MVRKVKEMQKLVVKSDTIMMTDDISSSEDIPDCIRDFSHDFSNSLGSTSISR